LGLTVAHSHCPGAWRRKKSNSESTGGALGGLASNCPGPAHALRPLTPRDETVSGTRNEYGYARVDGTQGRIPHKIADAS